MKEDKTWMIPLGGVKQKVQIHTQDVTFPVLLFLHGGPGVCNRHAVMTSYRDLDDTFTLVSWDQRGSGGSWRYVLRNSLTIDRLCRDAKELTDWLCSHFHKDKIYIIGGSWGSELGTWLVYRYPEKIAAYVGFGQVVNGSENERRSYAFTLQQAQQANNAKDVATLKRLGPPKMGVYRGGYRGMMTQRRIMMRYGGYSPHPQKRSYFRATVLPMLQSRVYSLYDLFGLLYGHRRVLATMWPEVGTTDFPTTCTHVQVPYFIFQGRHDENTPASLVQGYYDKLSAPQKQLIWFDASGHNPLVDEGPRFKQLLRSIPDKIITKEPL